MRRAPSASSADFASALSPSVRTSGDDGSATGGTVGAGERESFLSRSAALLKKGGLRRHTDRGGASQRQASNLSAQPANVRNKCPSLQDPNPLQQSVLSAGCRQAPVCCRASVAVPLAAPLHASPPGSLGLLSTAPWPLSRQQELCVLHMFCGV